MPKSNKYDETYIIEVKCQNCKRPAWLTIPRGTTVEEFGEEKSPMCKICNCSLIKIKEKKEGEKDAK